MTNTEYNQHIDYLITSLHQQHMHGKTPTAADCVIGLMPRRAENRVMRDFALKTLKISAKEYDAAMRRETLKHDMDCEEDLPTRPSEFVEFMVNRMNITVSYNGILHRKETPYLDTTQGRQYIPVDRWNDYEFRTLVITKFQGDLSFDDFALRVRTFAADLDMPWSAGALNDACQMWFRNAIQERLVRIAGNIDHTNNTEISHKGQAMLLRLAESCFDTSEVSATFIAAVFNKFIWQVKRKINQIPVTDHLMPVLTGIQGNGKSTLVRSLLAPVNELWVPGDFKQMTDERNIDLWRNFVIFLDEMGWASKSDIDIVKNVVTAETLNRRVMYTNGTIVIKQRATFIGVMNLSELSDLIKDETGTRRFVTVTMIDRPDFNVINAMDWQAVWQSVDENAADPMLPHRATLAHVQAQDRVLTPVEEWLGTLDVSNTGHGWATSADMYLKFRDYQQMYMPGTRAVNASVFGREMSKRSKKDDSVLEARRNAHSKSMEYRLR